MRIKKSIVPIILILGISNLRADPITGYGQDPDGFASWYLSQYSDQELESFVLQKMDAISRTFTKSFFVVDMSIMQSFLLDEFFGMPPNAYPVSMQGEFGLNNIPIGIGRFSVNLGLPIVQTILALTNGGFDSYVQEMEPPQVTSLNSYFIGGSALFALDEAAFAEGNGSRYYCRSDLLSVNGSISITNVLDADFAYRDLLVRGGNLYYHVMFRSSTGKDDKDYHVSIDYSHRTQDAYLKGDIAPLLRYVRMELVPDAIVRVFIPESLGFSANFNSDDSTSYATSEESLWQQFNFGDIPDLGQVRLQLKETHLTFPDVWQVHGMLWVPQFYVESVFFPESLSFGMVAGGINWLWRLFVKDNAGYLALINVFGNDWPNFLGSSFALNYGNGFGYAQSARSFALYPVDVQYIIAMGGTGIGAIGKIGFGSVYGYPGATSRPSFLMQVGVKMFF